jgi:DNA-binding HxlR family transcriptional regulator
MSAPHPIRALALLAKDLGHAEERAFRDDSKLTTVEAVEAYPVGDRVDQYLRAFDNWKPMTVEEVSAYTDYRYAWHDALANAKKAALACKPPPWIGWGLLQQRTYAVVNACTELMRSPLTRGLSLPRVRRLHANRLSDVHNAAELLLELADEVEQNPTPAESALDVHNAAEQAPPSTTSEPRAAVPAAGEQPAGRGGTGGSGGQGLVLIPADITILTVLEETTVALLYSEIVRRASNLSREKKLKKEPTGCILVSESTLSERVPLLEEDGLVCRPKGRNGKPTKRKGIAITKKGREQLRPKG